jgi:CRP/FNR family transcriptional regulator
MAEQDYTREFHKLFGEGRSYTVPKGNIVQSSDYRHVINLVRSGYIKRYMIGGDGNIGVQSIYGPQDVFPLTLVFKALFDQDIYHGPEVYHYQAMTDTELCSIDKTTLVNSAEKNPLIYKAILSEAGKRFNSNIQQLENIALKTAYNRVAHELYYFSKKFGSPADGGRQIDLPMSHQDIADILSITRETVSTCIKELRDKGLVKTSNGKKIFLPNPEKLAAEAYA